MFTNSFKDSILNTVRASALSAWQIFVGWCSAVTDAEGGTVTELSYTGYARTAALTMNAPGASANGGGRSIDNSALYQGGQKTDAGNVTAIALGLWTASSAGTLRVLTFIDADAPVLASVAASDTFTSPAHGLSDDQNVRVDETVFNTLPAGLAENTEYFVISSATDTFELSTSQGGGAVDVTAAGVVAVMPYTALTIGQNGTPQIAANALIVEL